MYKFARLCQFIDQTLRDVNIKFKNINRDEYEESTLRKNFNNQKSSREQSNASRSRFETSKSNLNNQKQINREINQALEFENQINAFIYYNCDKSDHIARRCIVSKKMNSNNFVRKIKKNTIDQKIESKKD